MANYIAVCRTNYFKVKDIDAFLEEMESIPDIKVDVEKDKGCVIMGNNADGAGWPSMKQDGDEMVEFDLPENVSRHLEDGEVAIFIECGSEKLCYLVGYAEAINNQGEREEVTINDIYKKALSLGNNVTRAEY